MKITIWHTDRFPTAPGVYLGCFPALGHEVTWVVVTEGDRRGIVERREGGVRHFEIRLPGPSRLPRPLGVVVNRWNKLMGFCLKARLMERLARERPDVLQVRDLVTEGLLGLGAARRHRLRFAYQLDHPHFEARLVELDHGDRARPFERLVMRYWIRLRRVVLRGADVVLPISDALASILRDREGVDPRRLVVFPVGVPRAVLDHPVGTHVDPRVVALVGRPTVCYLGNLEWRRDPDLIFRIFEEVGRRVPDSRFLVIGRSSDRVRGWLRTSPVAERVTFIPFVPYAEVPGLLGGARVGIYPIPVDDAHGVHWSCSPLKVMEYMSLGLAVVASRVRDAEMALEQSGGGVCVATEAGAFADAIEVYLRDPERARHDGQRGRAWVADHRTFDVLAGGLDAAYRRLVETGVPTPPGDR